MTATRRKPGPALLVTLCVAVGVSGAGCSFVFVDAPPPQHRKMPYFDCTSNNALPVVDSIVGGVYGIASLAELADRNQYSSSTTTETLSMLGVAALFAASGIHGFAKTSSCREAKADLVRRASQQQGGYGASGFAPASPPPGYGMPAPYDPWMGPPAAAAPPDTPPPGASSAPAPPPPAPPPPAPPPQPVDPDGPTQP